VGVKVGVVGVTGLGGLWALKWAWQTASQVFAVCGRLSGRGKLQSTGIDENNTFQLKFFSSIIFAVCGRLSGRGKLFF